MKTRWKIAMLCSFLAAFWLYKGEASKAPDENLASHLQGICKIAKANAVTPVKGVQRLFHFLGHHSSSMMKEFGDTLVLIERIANDEAHDDRARQAGKRIRKPLLACERDLERFFLAVESNPKAQALFEKGANRLGRTLELMFGEEGAAISSSLTRLVTGEAPSELPPSEQGHIE